MGHISVLLQEAIDGLDIKAGDVFVDGTYGAGGHTAEVVRRFGETIKIFAIDADITAISRGKALGSGSQGLASGNVTLIHGNFRNIDELLRERGIEHIDKVLLDIGFSSDQLVDGRGLSFRTDEPLDMRFSTDQELTAETIVNEWDEETLRTIIKAYGEERWAGRIARGIVRTRELSPIKTTTDLVNIILSATPRRYQHERLHPATRTFQALRITVNDELQALQEGMEKSFHILNPGGRLAIISFHSLEDRLVKNYFKILEQTKLGKRMSKKPLIAKEVEREENPRSRSAKLRIIEKI